MKRAAPRCEEPTCGELAVCSFIWPENPPYECQRKYVCGRHVLKASALARAMGFVLAPQMLDGRPWVSGGPCVWRVGRTLGRTLYVDDQCVGMVDTPQIAAAIVEAMNESLRPGP